MTVHRKIITLQLLEHKTAVGTGSDLVYYSGYGSSNYLTKNGIPAPGTGDFSVSAWVKY